jgi:hypothetical protein
MDSLSILYLNILNKLKKKIKYIYTSWTI